MLQLVGFILSLKVIISCQGFIQPDAWNSNNILQVISTLVLGSAVAAPQDYQSYLDQIHQYRWQLDSWIKCIK